MDRMRYPKQALELIRELDPGTSVTLNYIRALAASKKISVVMIGRRRLINMESLISYLSSSEEQEAAPQYGKIRKLRA